MVICLPAQDVQVCKETPFRHAFVRWQPQLVPIVGAMRRRGPSFESVPPLSACSQEERRTRHSECRVCFSPPGDNSIILVLLHPLQSLAAA
jgi:hypothetical protein